MSVSRELLWENSPRYQKRSVLFLIYGHNVFWLLQWCLSQKRMYIFEFVIFQNKNLLVAPVVFFYHFRVSLTLMNGIAITVTSQWVAWGLKSPASGLFAQWFVQAHIKVNIKAYKGPITRKMFPFDNIIMVSSTYRVPLINCPCSNLNYDIVA